MKSAIKSMICSIERNWTNIKYNIDTHICVKILWNIDLNVSWKKRHIMYQYKRIWLELKELCKYLDAKIFKMLLSYWCSIETAILKLLKYAIVRKDFKCLRFFKMVYFCIVHLSPGIYLFKVSNRNTRAMC